MALKDNHATPHGEVRLLFDVVTAVGLTNASCDPYPSGDADPGRIETRRYWLSGDIGCLGVKGSWANVAAVGLVGSRVELGDVVACERRYFLTSLGVCGAFCASGTAALGYREFAPLGA